MADEQPKDDNEVTPQGAAEIDEQDLDQAAGGASSSDLPMETVSLNYSKIVFDTSTQRVAPQDASIGLLSETAKKP